MKFSSSVWMLLIVGAGAIASCNNQAGSNEQNSENMSDSMAGTSPSQSIHEEAVTYMKKLPGSACPYVIMAQPTLPHGTT